MTLLHDDRDIIVVDKPSGLLSIDYGATQDKSAFSALTLFINKGDPKGRKKLFAVHRLDREASGILLFAKSHEVLERLQESWHDTTRKTYLCVVHGHWAEKNGRLESYLIEEANMSVHSTTDRVRGKLSITDFQVLRETRDYSLMEIDLLTGRKHQIRVHMSEAGHPIVGDQKYGADTRYRGRLALHAARLSILHPYSGALCVFEAPIPHCFSELVGALKRPAASSEQTSSTQEMKKAEPKPRRD